MERYNEVHDHPESNRTVGGQRDLFLCGDCGTLLNTNDQRQMWSGLCSRCQLNQVQHDYGDEDDYEYE